VFFFVQNKKLFRVVTPIIINRSEPFLSISQSNKQQETQKDTKNKETYQISTNLKTHNPKRQTLEVKTNISSSERH